MHKLINFYLLSSITINFNYYTTLINAVPNCYFSGSFPDIPFSFFHCALCTLGDLGDGLYLLFVSVQKYGTRVRNLMHPCQRKKIMFEEDCKRLKRCAEDDKTKS